MNSDTRLLLSTPPKRKSALLLEPVPVLSPWESVRVAEEVRESIKRAKIAAVKRAELNDCRKKITINSYTSPTPFGNVGGKPPLPATSNAVLLYNVGKKFHSNLTKFGWECSPCNKAEWCMTGAEALQKERAFVSCLQTLQWPFSINLHYAGNYSPDYISSSDIKMLKENPRTASRIAKHPSFKREIKIEPGVSAPAPGNFVDLCEFEEFDDTDYAAVFSAMDKANKKKPPPTKTKTSTILAPAAVFSADSDDDTDAEGAAAPAPARAPAPAPAPIVFHQATCEQVKSFFAPRDKEQEEDDQAFAEHQKQAESNAAECANTDSSNYPPDPPPSPSPIHLDTEPAAAGDADEAAAEADSAGDADAANTRSGARTPLMIQM